MGGKIFIVGVIFFLFIHSVVAARLPEIGGDNETWGDILNEFLNVSMSPNGTFWPNIVNNTYLSNDSVFSENVVDGTIMNADISPNAGIGLSKLQNLSNALTLRIENITSFDYNYNQTAPAVDYCVANFINSTAISGDYYNKSEVDLNLSLFYLSSNPNGYFNSTTLPNQTISSGSINSTHIVGGSITGSDLAVGSVNATHILDLTIIASDIANGVITSAKLVAGVITSDYLAVDSINSSHLQDNSVTTSKILDRNVTSEKIAVGAINSTHLDSGIEINVTVSANSINSTHIADGGVNPQDISEDLNFTFHSVNVSNLIAGFELVTDECNSGGCTANASCDSGSTILHGLGSTTNLLSGLFSNSPDVVCQLGSSSCSATESDLVFNRASVQIVCARIVWE